TPEEWREGDARSAESRNPSTRAGLSRSNVRRTRTLRQVVENTESTDRQYALRQRAVALGWPIEQVVVIDRDLGQAGAPAADREGFQQLVRDVGLGRAGLVMGLGGLAPGPQFHGLAPPLRNMRINGNAHPR